MSCANILFDQSAAAASWRRRVIMLLHQPLALAEEDVKTIKIVTNANGDFVFDPVNVTIKAGQCRSGGYRVGAVTSWLAILEITQLERQVRLLALILRLHRPSIRHEISLYNSPGHDDGNDHCDRREMMNSGLAFA